MSIVIYWHFIGMVYVVKENIAEVDLFDDSQFDYKAEEDFITKQLITYIGNKRSLLKFIGQGVEYAQNKLNKDDLVILDGFND